MDGKSRLKGGNTMAYDPTKNPFSAKYNGDLNKSSLSPFAKKILQERQNAGYADTDKKVASTSEMLRNMGEQEFLNSHPANTAFVNKGKVNNDWSNADYMKQAQEYQQEMRRRYPTATKRHHALLGSDQGGQ
jgi:hypothetical protein